MLIVSKRLHSIYMLRCFNDCWAVGAMFLAIYLFQRRHWAYGAVAFSAGVGIKMSLLVALPAVAVLIYQAVGPNKALTYAMYMIQVQVRPLNVTSRNDPYHCSPGKVLCTNHPPSSSPAFNSPPTTPETTSPAPFSSPEPSSTNGLSTGASFPNPHSSPNSSVSAS